METVEDWQHIALRFAWILTKTIPQRTHVFASLVEDVAAPGTT
jgi:hypothetical protein